MKYKNIDQAIKKLGEYAALEGTELGEAWDMLVYLSQYKYCFSQEFNIAVIKEIFEQVEEADKFYEIVEEEISKPSYTRKILKRIDE